MQSSPEKILVGRVAGVYGVKGWLKIHSYTRPTENILSYSPWCIASARGAIDTRVEESDTHDKGLLAKVTGIDDREQARRWIDAEILIDKTSLPAPESGHYYWHQLMGLSVTVKDGAELGIIEEVLETGANDVIVVQGRERHLIPWVRHEYIIEVDLENGRLVVDWQGNQ
ncbi:MAG: ribosome maturation factor RimM [Thiotrichales bacterium]|nr:ribosome maturation factor RimM [Thiotrichales bacterium]